MKVATESAISNGPPAAEKIIDEYATLCYSTETLLIQIIFIAFSHIARCTFAILMIATGPLNSTNRKIHISASHSAKFVNRLTTLIVLYELHCRLGSALPFLWLKRCYSTIYSCFVLANNAG